MQLSGDAALDHLEDAKETQVPIEAKVVSRNKGGFEVMIGSVRAFCPMSRISRIQAMDLDGYVGQVLAFRVIETGDKIVLDRRVIQDEAAEVKATELWGTIDIGQELRGVVRNVQPFGFFVDVGGIDGLVPKREYPGDPPGVGVGLDVRVLEIDVARKRLTLSARAAGDDPWNLVGVDFVPGGIYMGTVARVAPFGAFVELSEGLQGLAHSSRFPGGLPKEGASLRVRLVEVDRDRQRLDLAPVAEGAEDEAPVGEQVKGIVAEVMRNGLVVQLDDGRTAWLPAGEVDLPGGTVLAQRFRKGKPIEARVSQAGDRRVVLSMKEDPAESSRAWRSHLKKAKAGGFGTLGDLLGGLDLPKK
jgi:small subunit ribosomal protein S1